MRRFKISHVTEYLFFGPVSLLPHRLLLRPRESHNLRIESSILKIFPGHTLQWKRDVLDNSVAVVGFPEPSDRLCISSDVVIQHYEENPFDYSIEEQADLAPFREAVYPTDREAIKFWLSGLDLRQPIETFPLLNRINREIASQLFYQRREEPGVQSPAQTLAHNSGSCRDFAALFMEACRHMGLASRFVSGYLYTPDIAVCNASTHAWAEVYLPGPGWKGFDPTSGEVTGDRHVAAAVARHPEAVPPVAGSYIGQAGQHPSLNVTVQVSALAP